MSKTLPPFPLLPKPMSAAPQIPHSATKNQVAYARRYHRGRGGWEADQKLAMVVDLEARELQCFEGRTENPTGCLKRCDL